MAWRHDLVAVCGMDESIDEPSRAIDDLAARLQEDGVRVDGARPVECRRDTRPVSRLKPAPRSCHGPKRSVVDAEHTEVRRYLSPIAEGAFLEIGANQPIVLSQSYHLQCVGWKGVLVEPIPALAQQLRIERAPCVVVEAVCSKPGAPATLKLRLTDASGHATLMDRFADHSDVLRSEIDVTVCTADSIIQNELHGRVDFISIDVEGHEADVLAGLDLRRWRPRLVLVEDDMQSLHTSMALWRKGYRMLRRTQNNNWWIPADARDRMSLQERWRMLGKFLRMPVRALRARVPRRRH